MTAFEQLDWSRFDVWAAVALDGIVAVDRAHHESCSSWLLERAYTITSIDFAKGIGPAVTFLGEMLRWENQFGYRLTSESRNLSALRDGFDFGLQPGQGHVLELLNVEQAHQENPGWLFGLLAISREYSRWQLALGSRFFAVLILEAGSPMVGIQYEALTVPVPYWRPGRPDDPFR